MKKLTLLTLAAAIAGTALLATAAEARERQTTITGANGKTDWPKGYSCIAEKRAIETIQDGKPSTEFMQFGDTIRIEMKGKDGQSIFGAIDQTIVPLKA